MRRALVAALVYAALPQGNFATISGGGTPTRGTLNFTFTDGTNNNLVIADDGTDAEVQIPDGSTLDVTDGTNNLVQVVDRGTVGSVHATGGVTVGSTTYFANYVSVPTAGGYTFDTGDVTLRQSGGVGTGLTLATPAGTGLNFNDTNVAIAESGTNILTLTAAGGSLVDGSADVAQLTIQGNATQTASLVVFENSAGTDTAWFDVAGKLTVRNVATTSDVEVARFATTGGNAYVTVGDGTTAASGGVVIWDNTANTIRIGPHGTAAALTIGATTASFNSTMSTLGFGGDQNVAIGESGTNDLSFTSDGAVSLTLSGGATPDLAVPNTAYLNISDGTNNLARFTDGGTGLGTLRLYGGYLSFTDDNVQVAESGTNDLDVTADGAVVVTISSVGVSGPGTNGNLTVQAGTSSAGSGSLTLTGGSSSATPVRVLDGTQVVMDFNSSGTVGSLGTGTATPTLAGTLNVNTTAVGNVGAGEDDLITYALPANSLVTTGRGVWVHAYGSFANNANAKTLTCYAGTQAVLTNAPTVSVAGELWTVDFSFIRTGASAQDWKTEYRGNTGAAGAFAFDPEMGTATQTETAAITIKCTGTATSDNDVVMDGLVVSSL